MPINFYIRIILLFVFINNSKTVFSQTSNTENKVIPASPNVASLLAYAQVPVSKYSGLPEINISIYTVKSGVLEMPINISYHASGIKVSQEASLVGLGWALNTGGVIGRSIRGQDDFSPTSSGYSKHPYPNDLFYADQWYSARSGMTPSLANLHQMVRGDYDTEPDLFYFNFCGFSGKFYLQKQNGSSEVIGICQDLKNNLKIQSLDNGRKWLLTDGNGTKYYFDTPEYNSTDNREGSPNESGTEARDIPFSSGFCQDTRKIGSWYLDKIEASTGDKIEFSYSVAGECTGVVSPATLNTQSYKPDNSPSTNTYTNNTFSKTLTEEVVLDAITFKNGTVIFHTGSRTDIEAHSYSPKKLDSITVVDNQHKSVHKTGFTYNYFDSSRLKLNSFTIADQKYTFTYDESINLPAKQSNSQDHWGYYNGAINSSLIPMYSSEGIRINETGGTRDVNPMYSKAYHLKSILYPTGGKTEFDMEPNTFSTYAPIFDNIAYNIEASRSYYSNGNHPIMSYKDFYVPPRDYHTTTPVTLSVYATSDKSCWQVPADSNRPFATLIAIPDTTATVYEGLDEYQGASDVKEIYYYEECTESKDVGISIRNHLELSPGWYRIAVEAANYTLTTAVVSYETIIGYKTEALGAGLRVKQIREYEQINATPIIRRYEYKNTDGTPSGILQTSPHYQDKSTVSFERRVYNPSQEVEHQVQITERIVSNKSSSFYPLSTEAMGSYIGYSEVREFIGNNAENGAIYSTFNNSTNYSSMYVPPELNQLNGLPIKESILAGNKDVLKTTEYFYNRDLKPANNIRLKAMSIEFCPYLSYIFPSSEPWSDELRDGAYLISYYDIFCQWWKLDSTRVTNYAPTGNLTTIKQYKYNEINKQILQEINLGSDQSKLITRYKYPVDYTANANSIFPVMVNRNIVNPVIEVQQLKEKNGVEQLLSSNINQYKEYHNKFIKPYRTFNLNNQKPLETSGIPNIAPFNNLFISGLTYDQENEFDYNLEGNVISVTNKQKSIKNYLWGYGNQYPVLELMNAPLSNAFYNGFEENEGNQVGGKMGYKSRTGGYTRTMTGLDNGIYNLEYWQKNAERWVFKSAEVNVNDSTYQLNLTGDIDEIRFYPKGSRLKTYTYFPIVGLSAIMDEKGLVTYYEYDNFQRLKTLKDNDGNIIKSYNYHYR